MTCLAAHLSCSVTFFSFISLAACAVVTGRPTPGATPADAPQRASVLPTVYVSGDNASLSVVRSVAARARVDIAILFGGGAKSPRLLGDALLTLDGDGAAAAATLLPDAHIVPVHFRGWSHFTQGGDAIRASFTAAALSGRLHLLDPGRAWVSASVT
jgi:hypothetical protein